MNDQRLTLTVLGASALLLAGCGGGSSSAEGGGSASVMDLLELSNGFGQLVPHTIVELDENEVPTINIISIRNEQDLIDNLRPNNPIRPVPKFEQGTVLPSGDPGNHFLYARFTNDIFVPSVMDSSPGAQANSGLTGAVTVIAIDPITGESMPIRGRAFIDGRTFGGPVVTDENGNPVVQEQTWVVNAADGTGQVRPRVVDPSTGEIVDGEAAAGFPGHGFPGTEANFHGSDALISARTIVFVVDEDGDLSTHETFPVGRQIRMRITTALQSAGGKSLMRTVLGSTTVGPDFLGPEVGRTPPPLNAALISPGSGDTDVDPLTAIRIEFTEPVQPLSLGNLDDGTPPKLGAAVQVAFGPDAARTQVPFGVKPISVFDLSTFSLVPGFHFPGSGPGTMACATFNEVDIAVNPQLVQDLAANPGAEGEPEPNLNLLGANTSFFTGEGPGLVNVPVAPDAIYVGRVGATAGISVTDLNGFGASTGNPTYDDTFGTFEEGNSYYPINPNVRFQGSQLRPPLAPGTCTIDGGSAGVFTLTKDSNLSDLLVRPPIVSSVGDIHIGQALDGTFNNALFPFGCQSGGGNLCALPGLKIIAPVAVGNVLQPNTGLFLGPNEAGAPNIISWSPHPNPPPLAFPPLCVSPFLNALEPTSVDMVLSVPVVPNLLAPGDPFGDPINGVPPWGLLTPEQNTFFLGPSTPQQQILACNPYQIRQQVGHFLYVLDRQRREITVLNSNRMTVVERISLPDPTQMAMGPNLDFIAVTNQLADVVSFIDIDPRSSTFHQIVKTIVVGQAPRGIAWQPGNEDILVCNEGSNSVSIVAATNFEVRKEVFSNLQSPFDVAITERQANFGFLRNVYFAWILNRSGDVAVFESGPNGVNGWGFDDILGVTPFEFRNPKAIQTHHTYIAGAVWIAHEGPIEPGTGQPGNPGEGAISELVIESALTGQLFLNQVGTGVNPQFRDMEFAVRVSVGQDQLSGVPVDLAFDNLRSWGGTPNYSTFYSAGSPAPLNGKNTMRPVPGSAVNTNEPKHMFAAIPNALGATGVIDVLDLQSSGAPTIDTNPHQPGKQSIPASNATVVADYWRQ